MALMLMPSIALAHDDKEGRGIGASLKTKVNAAIDARHNDEDDDDKKSKRSVRGTVTAVSSTGFELKKADGTVYTVLIADAKITGPFGQGLALANISVNDLAVVKGSISGSQITATKIVVTPKNTHPAVAKGKVTAVSGNTITLQSQHRGVAYSVTVSTNASTTVQTADSATTTAAIQVGKQLKVKGLWNELLNVLTAIKIKILN